MSTLDAFKDFEEMKFLLNQEKPPYKEVEQRIKKGDKEPYSLIKISFCSKESVKEYLEKKEYRLDGGCIIREGYDSSYDGFFKTSLGPVGVTGPIGFVL